MERQKRTKRQTVDEEEKVYKNDEDTFKSLRASITALDNRIKVLEKGTIISESAIRKNYD